jgi:ParB-like chromosome segregation protein Spo0J/N6-adenosine-specific RNA methylase IME4
MSATGKYQVMPPLTGDERAALLEDIKARGVMVPVEYDEQGEILDGHHRVDICNELGIANWPRLIRYGLAEDEKLRHARRLNLDRRHLNAEQRRELIAAELKAAPERSDRAIGAGLGVDGKTVGAVRDDLESTAEIPQLETRIGRDQRKRMVQYVDPSPEGIRGTKAVAKTILRAERDAGAEGRRNLAQGLSDTSATLATGRRFPCIYADPAVSRKGGIGDRAYENHYPTMTWPEILALPVKNRVLPDAWLFLWLPRAHVLAPHKVETDVEIEDGEIRKAMVWMPLATAIANAWGFEDYSTLAVWTKTDEVHPDDHGTGLIYYDQDEILLLFKRGRGLPMPPPEKKHGSNHRERSKPLGHSSKPLYYRDMIVDMTGGLPVLELFARADPDNPLPKGWDIWGNQS